MHRDGSCHQGNQSEGAVEGDSRDPDSRDEQASEGNLECADRIHEPGRKTIGLEFFSHARGIPASPRGRSAGTEEPDIHDSKRDHDLKKDDYRGHKVFLKGPLQ